jgi:hypothetical protein
MRQSCSGAPVKAAAVSSPPDVAARDRSVPAIVILK